MSCHIVDVLSALRANFCLLVIVVMWMYWKHLVVIILVKLLMPRMFGANNFEWWLNWLQIAWKIIWYCMKWSVVAVALYHKSNICEAAFCQFSIKPFIIIIDQFPICNNNNRSMFVISTSLLTNWNLSIFWLELFHMGLVLHIPNICICWTA